MANKIKKAVFDHSATKWSTPDTTPLFISNCLIDFKKSQCEKYNLPLDSPVLLKCDIYYTHRDPAALQLLKQNNMRVAYIPANMTDELQEMDVNINGPMKERLSNDFVSWRADKSIAQLKNGVDAKDVYVNYGLKAIKNVHVGWVASAWKYCEEQGFIKQGFEKVDNNLVGYDRWDDSWIQNKQNNNDNN